MVCSLGAARYTKRAVVATCWLQHVSHMAVWPHQLMSQVNSGSSMPPFLQHTRTRSCCSCTTQHWHTRTTFWNSAVQSLRSTCQQLLAALQESNREALVYSAGDTDGAAASQATLQGNAGRREAWGQVLVTGRHATPTPAALC